MYNLIISNVTFTERCITVCFQIVPVLVSFKFFKKLEAVSRYKLFFSFRLSKMLHTV